MYKVKVWSKNPGQADFLYQYEVKSVKLSEKERWLILDGKFYHPISEITSFKFEEIPELNSEETKNG